MNQPLSSGPAPALSGFIDHPAFPCVGAKSALHRGRVRSAAFGGLGDAAGAAALCGALARFSDEFPEPGANPVSFIATFENDGLDDAGFERALWRHLQAMHDHDRMRFRWDASVGSDPGQSDFSFSIAGRAFFVVGLHPRSMRLSRRAPMPCLVFNFHDQFETLKASGKYQSMQKAIRVRDLALQGSINPELTRFGEASEARQYAGRAVPADWRCPFSASVSSASVSSASVSSASLSSATVSPASMASAPTLSGLTAND